MNDKLTALAEDLAETSSEVRGTFTGLSAEQLNWKPSPEKWSVGQCFDHLIAGDREMLGQIDLKIRGQEKPTFFEKLPLLPRVFGPLVVKAVSPESARKVKNPKILDPAASDIPADVIERFLDGQEKVAAAMKASGQIDLERTIMTSPVAAFVTYSLLDGFRIIVYHEKRHVIQAKRVMATEGFPGLAIDFGGSEKKRMTYSNAEADKGLVITPRPGS